MSFQIHALKAELFEDLFSLSDEALKDLHARREIVESYPGTPCRISLEDARVGEEVLLVHYEHQAENTPYKASHAVFIRKGVEQAFPKVDEIPMLFRHRLMSLRAFDVHHSMIDAEAVEGTAMENAIERLLSNPAVDYIHLHNAKPGCYAALITRAQDA